MTYDPTWIRNSPILIPQAIHNDAIIGQKGSVRLDALEWGQKVGLNQLDSNQNNGTTLDLTPLNNNKMFVAWSAIGVGTAGQGRFSIVDSSGNMDSTAYHIFDTQFIDYSYGIATATLQNGHVVIAYGQDQGAENALVFKIFDEQGNLVKDTQTVKTHATETNYAVDIAVLADGNFVIVFEEAAAGLHSYFAIYDADGDMIRGYTSLGGQKPSPQAAPLANGNWVATYGTSNVSYQIYDRQGIQVVGETLFRSGVSQAPGIRSLANGNLVVPFTRGFGILDRDGNVVVAPSVKEVGGTYAITVLPHDNIVAQNDNGTNAYYKVYDSDGNIIGTQNIYGTAPTPIINSRTATFKDGSFFFAHITDPTSNQLNTYIYQGTKAGFGGDLTIDGEFGLATGTTVNEISTDNTLASNSDSVLVTEKAIKYYVDNSIGSLSLNKIYQGNSQVIVLDDASDITSTINIQIDSAIIANYTSEGLQIGSGVRVAAIDNSSSMGGHSGAVGSQTKLVTQYAVRKYIDDIHDITSEPTGVAFGNSNSVTTIGIDGSNVFYIEPYSGGNGTYNIFFSGQRWIKNSKETIEISDVEGLHYIYFDSDGVLKETTAFSITFLYSKVYIAVVYWDATNKRVLYLGDERHGITMDGKTHANIHLYRGTLYYSGLAVSDITADGTGALDIEAQFSSESGYITDEDITLAIPAYPFPANVTMWYLDGSVNWRYQEANNFAVVNTGTGRIGWNKNTAGTWSIEEATDGYFVLTHIYATNDIEGGKEMVGIVGQAEYATIEAARIGATDELNNLLHGHLPFEEALPVATLIFETSDSFSNTPKAIIRTNDEGATWTDWRTSGLSPGCGSVSDHGSLSGLGNDDHLQYFYVDGRRAITGNLSVNGTTTLQGTTLITAPTTISAGGLTISSGTFQLPFGTSINELSTDGTLADNSDDAIPTEQAVKTYVDTSINDLNPDKIWKNDSKVEVVDDGTNAGYVTVVADGTEVGNHSAAMQWIGVSGDTSITLNQSANLVTISAGSGTVATFGTTGLTLVSGTNINEFSTDGTLAGNSDNAVPTEQAVKTYVDAEIAAVVANDNEIHADDSRVTVWDDGTNAGWVEVVVDGVQVQYWDSQATSIRMGKASGAGRVTVTDTSVTSSVGADELLYLTPTSSKVGLTSGGQLSVTNTEATLQVNSQALATVNATVQTFGVGTTTSISFNQSGHSAVIYTQGTDVFQATNTAQRVGASGDSRLEVDQSANTVDLYAGTVHVLTMGTTQQILGAAGDTRLVLDQAADTFTLHAGTNTVVSGGLTLLTLGVAGDTTIALDQSTDQVSITAGGQSQILVETSGTTVYDDLTITGDLFVDGTTFVVNQTEVRTSDNLITLNYGEVGAGVTAGTAGIEIDRGTLNNYYFLFAENTDTFRIGESVDGTSFANLQAVATREDSPTSMVVPWWNDTDKRFDTLGSSSITINTSTDVITFTAASSPVATFESDGLTLASGTNINEFSTDGTLAGNSDDAVPTEQAVKTYVDAQIGGQSHIIFQDNSWVKVTDDGTNAGRIEVVADGVQVQYWDAEATSIRMGKASGAGRITVTDTSITASIVAADVLTLTGDTQRIGVFGDTLFQVVQTTNTLSGTANNVEALSLTDTSQRIGVLNGTSAIFDQSANTVTFEANNVDVVVLAETSQTIGVSGDTRIELNQTNDTLDMYAGSVSVFDADTETVQIGISDTFILLDSTSNNIVISENSVSVLTIAEAGITLENGATINEFSIDGTLTGNSDTAVPTEKAVKTYVDTQIANLNPDKIWEGNSYVEVIDDGTNAGYVTIVTDGVEVAHFDAQSTTQRIGKLSESRMLVADEDITFYAGASPTQQLDINGSGIQLATGERVNSISLSSSLGTSNTTLVTQGAVKSYADTGDLNTLSSAQLYADNVETAANNYTDTQIGIVTSGYQAGDATTLIDANAYTDASINNLRNELDLINMKTVTTDSTAITGDVILVDTTAGDVNIEMQVGEDSRIIIKKKTTDGNRVNISTSSGTIDGQNLVIIDTPYQSFTFVSDGSNFYII